MRKFFAAGLVTVAAWTLVRDFISPALIAMEGNMPPTSHINWSMWWAVQLALAWQLVRPTSMTWIFAVAVSWTEIAIIGAKITIPALQRKWPFFHTNLFANECAALLVFVGLVAYLHGTSDGKKLK